VRGQSTSAGQSRYNCYHLKESWDAFPYVCTVMTNEYMKDDFLLQVDTVHLEDSGDTENAFSLSQNGNGH